MSLAKPIPDKNNPITRPYWEGAANDQLRIQRCESCGHHHHPPVAICWHCQSTNLTFDAVSGRGKVYTFTVVHDQRNPIFDRYTPFVLVRVELDDAPGVVVLASLVGAKTDQVKIGTAVQVEFESIADGVKIPQFRLVGEAGEVR